MSRGGALLGRRALQYQITHTTNKEGFIEDPFWGASVPPEIASLPNLVEDSGRDHFRASLGLSVHHLSGKDVEEEDLEDVGQALFQGTTRALLCAIRSKAEEEKILNDLQALSLSPDVSKDFVQALSRARTRILSGPQLSGPSFPSLEDMRWRVDVTISTTSLSRVMRPTILMQWTLSDGSIETFEVSVDKLQDLRYDVAKSLQELKELENTQLFRLHGASKTKATKETSPAKRPVTSSSASPAHQTSSAERAGESSSMTAAVPDF
ncbi:hypothetical protein GUITHDRAFT_154763 [Guillardia theta CCMP2712]|uniref:COMM domain-containing protein 5 n=2 Tax=Guillardia theta TaxID=55529 RepID=L1IQZ4_GUITC|nr:hypothetical protein GUITHDRAFT_154763 [Guillardia theta CCMP2712]EKX38279.1 hypothetical protein GUITHDRAFT_154763 [Guillardia theta CCMP2712]|eukprot:XP_005825259.1 hypothetical protein GUITHDRAFT_154763 [Guillardia theta CCMP2712]